MHHLIRLIRFDSRISRELGISFVINLYLILLISITTFNVTCELTGPLQPTSEPSSLAILAIMIHECTCISKISCR
jgi:hypothetical protein